MSKYFIKHTQSKIVQIQSFHCFIISIFYQFKPNTPVYLACLGGVGEPEHPEKTHATLESLVLKTTMSLGKGASGGGGWVDGWAACAPES